MSETMHRVLVWVVALLVTIGLALTAVRILLMPWFLTFEYNKAGFPADPYGFTKEERLYWSNIALDYLLNAEGIEFLGDLRFEDGTAVYNERELRHMVDVKNALQAALTVWYISLAGLAGLAFWAWRGRWWETFRQGLVRGGWLTIFLVGTIILLVLVSFGVFFVAFHNVFFDPGTWTFPFSDTLIRLFPEKLWQDVFITVGAIALAGALALIVLFRKPAFAPDKSSAGLDQGPESG